jgi:hypothetical protein
MTHVRVITATVDIDASATAVWATLVDLAHYSEWNPFIRQASGQVAVGQRLNLRLFPDGGRPMKFTPRVVVADPDRELRWQGRVLVPGIFDGEHSFTMAESRTGRTRLVQSERFTGALVPFTGKALAATERSFRALNEALKSRVES